MLQTRKNFASLGLSNFAGELRAFGLKVKTGKDGKVSKIGSGIFLKRGLLEKAMGIKARHDGKEASASYQDSKEKLENIQFALNEIINLMDARTLLGEPKVTSGEMDEIGKDLKLRFTQLAQVKQSALKFGYYSLVRKDIDRLRAEHTDVADQYYSLAKQLKGASV